MGTKIFEIDEEMSEIIDAKVGNPQNSTSKKWANFSQPWNLAFFQDYIFHVYMLIFKCKEYQSEKSTIFDSQKSTKTTIKLLKICQLKAFKVDQEFCNTLYSILTSNYIDLRHTVEYNSTCLFLDELWINL